MIERYDIKEISDWWGDEKKYESWLLVELYAVEAFAKHNKNITKKDLKNLWLKCRVDVNDIEKKEKETKHDVVAFTRSLSEQLGSEKKWIHYGMTSTDIVDTALGYRFKKINEILKEDIYKLQETIRKLAIENKDTYQMGRTHGVHAEITTFGYKLALWWEDINRIKKVFKSACDNVEVGKISGAVGNYSNVPLDIQEYVCDKLGIKSSKISTQILQRDRHSFYLFSISLIASELAKIAKSLRHLQRTEISEVQEGFSKGQKGSSAMPHKKNPISSENIEGLARVIHGYVTPATMNVGLWDERDISHSSGERIILKDSTTLLSYILRRLNRVLENLYVNKDNMLKNIEKTKGVVFSQRLLLILINDRGFTRENSYDLIQPLAIYAFDNNLDFKDVLLEKQKEFTKKDLDEIFDYKYYTTRIKDVYDRLGIYKKTLK